MSELNLGGQRLAEKASKRTQTNRSVAFRHCIKLDLWCLLLQAVPKLSGVAFLVENWHIWSQSKLEPVGHKKINCIIRICVAASARGFNPGWTFIVLYDLYFLLVGFEKPVIL